MSLVTLACSEELENERFSSDFLGLTGWVMEKRSLTQDLLACFILQPVKFNSPFLLNHAFKVCCWTAWIQALSLGKMFWLSFFSHFQTVGSWLQMTLLVLDPGKSRFAWLSHWATWDAWKECWNIAKSSVDVWFELRAVRTRPRLRADEVDRIMQRYKYCVTKHDGCITSPI